eukprot:12022824-Karenia_brevis.AAC.1
MTRVAIDDEHTKKLTTDTLKSQSARSVGVPTRLPKSKTGQLLRWVILGGLRKQNWLRQGVEICSQVVELICPPSILWLRAMPKGVQ